MLWPRPFLCMGTCCIYVYVYFLVEIESSLPLSESVYSLQEWRKASGKRAMTSGGTGLAEEEDHHFLMTDHPVRCETCPSSSTSFPPTSE